MAEPKNSVKVLMIALAVGALLVAGFLGGWLTHQSAISTTATPPANIQQTVPLACREVDQPVETTRDSNTSWVVTRSKTLEIDCQPTRTDTQFLKLQGNAQYHMHAQSACSPFAQVTYSVFTDDVKVTSSEVSLNQSGKLIDVDIKRDVRKIKVLATLEDPNSSDATPCNQAFLALQSFVLLTAGAN